MRARARTRPKTTIGNQTVRITRKSTVNEMRETALSVSSTGLPTVSSAKWFGWKKSTICSGTDDSSVTPTKKGASAVAVRCRRQHTRVRGRGPVAAAAECRGAQY